jgi:hypothetical protein
MAHIETPSPTETIKNLSAFLQVSGDFHVKNAGEDQGMLSELWYRGVNTAYASQAPGVYRPGFTDRAKRLNVKGGVENKRLRLERDMLSQFRTAGAAFLTGYSRTQIYFVAQHYGMPTRLLDWSTNPLAALFFACEGQDDQDGYVYAMNAKQVIPVEARKRPGERLWQSVMTMRHAYVEYAIGLSFWDEPKADHNAFVLPVRPDAVPGRIGQQSSCFTLHMHGSAPVTNPTLITIRVDAGSKGPIREALHLVNINQYTTYNDLDHLSKELIRGWQIRP